MDLSIIVLTKNNSNSIRRCLESIGELDGEIIILDTGSTDNTKEICAEFNTNIYEKEFNFDFSDLRNEAMNHATKEWILMLDSDECLRGKSIKKLKELINSKPNKMAYGLNVINIYGNEEGSKFSALRLFRRRKEFSYKGKLHEQIVQSIVNNYGRESYILADIDILHYGYDLNDEEINLKVKRNLKILKSYGKEDKDGYYYYNLATEYKRIEEVDLAKKYYLKSYNHTKVWDIGYSAKLALDMVILLYEMKQYEEVKKYSSKLIEHYKEFSLLHLIYGLAYYNLKEYKEASNEIRIYEWYKKKSRVPYPTVNIEENINLGFIRYQLSIGNLK